MPCRPPLVIALLSIAVTAVPDTTGTLDWLSGRWCTTQGEERIEEIWLAPHGNTLLGLSRTMNAERTVAFEYLRIVDDGVLQYIAQPGGRPPTAFRLSAGGEQWLRFENPAHDFPQRIEYRRDGDNLHAEIAGPGENGETLAISFDYRPCDR